MQKASDDENLDVVVRKGDEDQYPAMDSKSDKGKEIPRIKGLRDPDTLDKHKLISNRYAEYR